jgi:hypothetical protein
VQQLKKLRENVQTSKRKVGKYLTAASIFKKAEQLQDEGLPIWLTGDWYLGDNNGLDNRQRRVEAQSVQSESSLRQATRELYSRGSDALEHIAGDIKSTSASYEELFNKLCSATMREVDGVIEALQSKTGDRKGAANALLALPRIGGNGSHRPLAFGGSSEGCPRREETP